MKLKDYINNENLIDSEFDIDRAVLNKNDKTVNVFFKVEDPLSYAKYVVLERKVNEFFYKMGLTSKINVTYFNEKYDGILVDYLDIIVKNITKRSPRFNVFR